MNAKPMPANIWHIYKGCISSPDKLFGFGSLNFATGETRSAFACRIFFFFTGTEDYGTTAVAGGFGR